MRIGSLEADLKQKTDRVKILETFANKLMSENKMIKAKKSEKNKHCDDGNNEELKKELKDKSEKVAVLTKQKSELVNGLSKCQDSMREEKSH